MKKSALFAIAVTIFTAIGYAGNPARLSETEWIKIFSRLSDYRLTGQSQQIPLSYAYDGLIPVIDARTVEIHYSKHFAGYTQKMNKGTAKADYKSTPLLELFD